ncbi:hypothetical protein K466DRAFT_667613, partial [Polyporus arcularius HHB13444]
PSLHHFFHTTNTHHGSNKIQVQVQQSPPRPPQTPLRQAHHRQTTLETQAGDPAPVAARSYLRHCWCGWKTQDHHDRAAERSPVNAQGHPARPLRGCLRFPVDVPRALQADKRTRRRAAHQPVPHPARARCISGECLGQVGVHPQKARAGTPAEPLVEREA